VLVEPPEHITDGSQPDGRALASVLEPFSPMALHVRRRSGAVVGRQAEQDAIRQELASAAIGRLAGLTLEGEPGIGKTRLLLAAGETAVASGFTTIAVTADEELRGPFLLARSILGSVEAVEATAGRADATHALTNSLDSMSGQDDPGLATLSADHRLLRTFDLGAVAFRALTTERPLAVLIDDLQWSDDDSIRLLRYVVRSDATCPIFLMLAIRPEEFALLTEAVNLIADLDRMGVLRRMKVERLTQAETGDLLASVLAGPVDPNGVAVMHAQAEGVPFIVEEMARAYREGGMIQQVDGTWRLAGNAERLVPSAVKTLISRRAAHLPDESKALLADAAVLGRRFSLKDLAEIERAVNGEPMEQAELARALTPAVSAGLLTEHAVDAAADYSFQHEQVRDFAAATLTQERRRAVHTAIVSLLMSGSPSPEALPLLAFHAKAAGDAQVCVRFSIEASRNALAANAPEEVLRVVELALSSAATSQERLDLLEARDRALDMLRRPSDRLEGLAELSALAEAIGDSHLELDVRLRRAAALRTAEEYERAAERAAEVRDLAAERNDRGAELAAAMELGQDRLRATAGESFTPSGREVDLDGADVAFRRAIELARELGDDATLAAALREAGVVQLGRVRGWFVEQIQSGAHVAIAERVAAGEVLEEMLPELEVAPLVYETSGMFGEALELFERVGDRRGVMATIIAMGYLSWAPDIHLGSSSARHIEEIRRLTSKAKAFTNESERAAVEAQMLYGVHVFARAKVIPDLALSRGEHAYTHAREMGDRSLEFLAAGGTAMAHVELGEIEQAAPWLERAATIASEHPSPLRARRIERWRGLARSAAGDVPAMRQHLEKAAELAGRTGLPAIRCEAEARLALEAARLGTERDDDELFELAERSARVAMRLAAALPGHPPWGAEALAALAQVELARGDREAAADHAQAAIEALISGMHEDQHLNIVLPAANVLMVTDAPGWDAARAHIRRTLAMIAQRTADEDVRVRWFHGPSGQEMTRLAGPLEDASDLALVGEPGRDDGREVSPDDRLLGSLIQGKTNKEIAEGLGLDEMAVARRLAELFAKIGASSRAEATAFAFQQRVL
jgi:DNA-binding CsgD family transcriptional regulator/tetratricopeptide (TPR) repeat protein